MAHLTNNTLFILSAVVCVVGLLFLAYPYLTLTAITLCVLSYTAYTHRRALSEFYSYLLLKFFPDGIDQQAPYISNLFSGVDLPSPIPHVSSLETVKNRRSPGDEIVSSTPRSSPTKYGGESAVSMSMRSAPQLSAIDCRQLSYGRLPTKAPRVQAQDLHQHNVESSLSQKLRNKSGGNGKAVQTMAGPLLSTARFNPTFDAGLFVNVNSPGFTDRLIRCANDSAGLWGHGNASARQDKYGSVGLFPIVHLSTPSMPHLSSRNSQKAPNSTVRVRIAPPVHCDQRHQKSRANDIPLRTSIPTRDLSRKNEVAKSVLESLQEASRKRIYSQCQEVLDEDLGKKRQRKSDSALPNPNCDIYQYRHIRAPAMPPALSANRQNDAHMKGKRLHDDSFPRANGPKRQCQHTKVQSVNNEISSSLSSSKTLLERLSGNKRKADHESLESEKGKQFKDSFNSAPSHSNSRWLHAAPCEEGSSAARTQEVVRSSKRKSVPDLSPASIKKPVVRKEVTKENITKDKATAISENKGKKSPSCEKVENDTTAKLFRKDIAPRHHVRPHHSEKKGSSWTQEPPDADERCLLEQSNSSDLDRPERFKGLLSRMCGQDVRHEKVSDLTGNSICEESPEIRASKVAVNNEQAAVSMTVAASPSTGITESSTTVTIPNNSLAVACTEAVSKEQSITLENTTPVLSQSFQSASPLPPQTSNSVPSSPPSYSATSAMKSTQDLTSTSLPSSVKSVPKPVKPMFNFTPPTPEILPQLLSQQAASPEGPKTLLGSSTGSTSISESIFSSNVSKEKSSPSPSDNKSLSNLPSISIPAKLSETSLQKEKFSFSVGHSPTSGNAFLVSLEKCNTDDQSNRFSLAGQNLQFATVNCGITRSPQATNEKVVFTPIPLTSSASSRQQGTVIPSNSFTSATSNQEQTSAPSTTSSGQKISFGGFQFGSPPGSQGDKSVASSAIAPSFSFSSVATTDPSGVPNVSSPLKAMGVDAGATSKLGFGSGSITTGSASTTISAPEPLKSTAFTFSSLVKASTSTTGPTKSVFEVQSLGAGTSSASPGFQNPSSQVLFNGIGSNPTSSSTPAFGIPSPQQPEQQTSQPQNQSLFSYGSSTNQPNSSAPAFGSGPSVAPSLFGGGTSSTYGATTTSGFTSQPAALSFSNSAFGASTTQSSTPFGALQSSSTTLFGGQAAASPPAFGVSSSQSPPTFGNTSSSTELNFGVNSSPSFGAPPSGEPSFGSNQPLSATPALGSNFSFGASTEKPSAPTFNFQTPNFSFGSSVQQPQSSSQLFQFGQAANPGSTPAFQFGASSPQPGVFSFGASSPSYGSTTNPVPLGSFTIGSGAPSFSMGSGPSTTQRSRSGQTRRRRL